MRGLSRTNLVLLVVLALLGAWLVVFAVRGAAAAPGRTPAEARAAQYAEIRTAARSATLAFLAVDHTRMDEVTQKVLDSSTGQFKAQYQDTLESLKEAATSQKSISKGRVDQVGLSEVDDDSAIVFVAAGSEVQNTSTKGEVQERIWRIKLTMADVDGRWLISQLEFVG